MRIRIFLCLILSLHILNLNSQLNYGEYFLKLIVKERKDNHMIFDYKINANINGTDAKKFVYIPLPFGDNPDLKMIVEPESANNMIYFGFFRPNAYAGICKIGLSTEKTNISITIKNAELTLQETGKNENIDAVTLSFSHVIDRIKEDSNLVLKINSIAIYSDEIKNTFPVCYTSEESPHEHKVSINNQQPNFGKLTLYFNNKEKPKTLVHLVFFLFALTFALFSTPSIILNSINWSITLVIVSFLLIAILSVFFYKEVYSTPFIKEYDVSGGIMGGIGLFMGLFINSLKNIIRIRRVNRIQGTP
ncbi:MAG: hypothetical protein LKG19_10485 [Saprospiraceae bacterium]|jgi:hypothetical protein|nr:hypothetical protein [Saprospiraceae bacterium]